MSSLACELDEMLTASELDFLCGVEPTGKVVKFALPSDEGSGHPGCGHGLGWRAPKVGAKAMLTVCPDCGCASYAEFRGDAAAYEAGANRSTPPRLPSGLSRNDGCDLVAELVGPGNIENERRRSTRYVVSAPVVGVPLGEQGAPAGEAIGLTVLDISSGGVGLMHQGEVVSDLLLVDFSQAGLSGVQRLCRVCWRQHAHGFTKLGCEYLD